MRGRCFAFGALLLPAVVAAEGIGIDHQAVGCAKIGQFPRFFARLDPEDQVARARVFFRPSGFPYWYSVQMQKEGRSFVGTLPKPGKGLAKFDYYISVLDRTFSEARTQEYSPDVVSGPMGCQQKMMAPVLTNVKSIVVSPPEGIAGAAKVPGGFSGDSVISGAPTAGTQSAANPGANAGAAAGAAGGAAAGGGLSGGAIAGIVAGGAAAVAGGVAVASHKSGSGSSPTPTQPSSFKGTLSAISFTVLAPQPPAPGCIYLFKGSVATLTLMLTDTGGNGGIAYPTPAGTIQYLAGPSICCSPSFCGPTGVSPGASLRFTVSGPNVSGVSDGAGGIGIFTLQGTLTGSTVSGTFSLAATAGTGAASGTWTATKQ